MSRIMKTQRAQRTQSSERKGFRIPIPSGLCVLRVLCVFFFEALLDRYALGEVARLIHVGSARHGHAVGQKLER